MNVTTSDPGASGLLTPHCKTDGLYFDSSREHEDGIFDLEKEIAIYNKRLEDIKKFTIDYMSDCDSVTEKLDREKKMLDMTNRFTMTKTMNNPNEEE